MSQKPTFFARLDGKSSYSSILAPEMKRKLLLQSIESVYTTQKVILTDQIVELFAEEISADEAMSQCILCGKHFLIKYAQSFWDASLLQLHVENSHKDELDDETPDAETPPFETPIIETLAFETPASETAASETAAFETAASSDLEYEVVTVSGSNEVTQVIREGNTILKFCGVCIDFHHFHFSFCFDIVEVSSGDGTFSEALQDGKNIF